MRVLITGAQGQVGQELMYSAPQTWHIYGLGSSELDISNKQQVLAVVNSLQPQLIINTAAYTAVDQAESDRLRAHAVNHLGAENLAKAAQAVSCPLLHLSTDYVFSGEQSKPYTEQDTPAPKSVYGQSKWLGEQAIRTQCAQHIILRSSWIFGAYGNNFVKTMLRIGQERTAVSIVSDQIASPTSARSIAQVLWQIAKQYQRSDNCAWSTYHFSGTPTCSWYEFASEIFKQATELQLISQSPLIRPIKTNSYPTAAQRPAYSALDNTKINQQFGISQKPWKDDLRLMLRVLKDAQQEHFR